MRFSAASASLLWALRGSAATASATASDGDNLTVQQASQDRRRMQTTGAVPAQMYFVPLPERDMIKAFDGIHSSNIGTSDVSSLTSVAVAAANTVLWYDHWEDGYEADITNPLQGSTMIFGDGNPANGCVEMIHAWMKSNPDYTYACQDGDTDLITKGEALLFKNNGGYIASDRGPYDAGPGSVSTVKETDIFYDGGDLIRSSFPIAMSRGGNPRDAGAYLAGAVEIVEADNYGMSFEAPVGPTTSSLRFGLTEMHIMASADTTAIYYNSAYLTTLNKGQTHRFEVDEGDELTATKPVQVHLLTGRKGSDYEMRWYSLLPTEKWSNDYYTPVSKEGTVDSFAYLHNPGSSSLTVTHENKNGQVQTIPIAAGSTTDVSMSTTGSGSRFHTSGGGNFFALTVTEAGRTYDWGHPLVPAKQLTSQALIGWGYGCTDNNCGAGGGQSSGTVRSGIWVTPVADANIYVDVDGDGTADSVSFNGASRSSFSASELQQVIVTNPTDPNDDMTGAKIWAQTAGGDNIDIAVAWGQQPSNSGNADAYGLDMGTVIMPLPELAAYKIWKLDTDDNSNGLVNAGDIIEYTIIITNTGRIAFDANNFNIEDDNDPLFAQSNYVEGSTVYYDFEGRASMPIADDDTDPDGTAFPLDKVGGISNKYAMGVDESHTIRFKVTIKDVVDSGLGDLTVDELVNTGRLNHNSQDLVDEFQTVTPIHFDPSIDIQTTVYGGWDGAACTIDSQHPELYTDLEGEPATYCYVVTNTGDTYLEDFYLTDDVVCTGDTTMPNLSIPGTFLAPGESVAYFCEVSVPASDATNTATVTNAIPTLISGYTVGDAQSDSDPAGVAVGAPLSQPPTAGPTAGPTELVGIDITGVDLCKNFSQYFLYGTEIEHFAFLAHTKDCVRARVYYNYRPLTQDEVDEASLDSDWTLMCDANVKGEGIGGHAYIPSEKCTTVFVPAGERVHFYIVMDKLDDTACVGSGAGGVAIDGYEIASIWYIFGEVCPVDVAP